MVNEDPSETGDSLVFGHPRFTLLYSNSLIIINRKRCSEKIELRYDITTRIAEILINDESIIRIKQLHYVLIRGIGNGFFMSPFGFWHTKPQYTMYFNKIKYTIEFDRFVNVFGRCRSIICREGCKIGEVLYITKYIPFVSEFIVYNFHEADKIIILAISTFFWFKESWITLKDEDYTS